MFRMGLIFWLVALGQCWPLGFKSISITVKTKKYPPLTFSMDSTGAAKAEYFVTRHPEPESLYAHRDDEQAMRRFWFTPKSDSARLDTEEVEKISSSICRLIKTRQNPKLLNQPKAIFLEIDTGDKRKAYVWEEKKKNKLVAEVLCTAFIDTDGVRGRYFSYINDMFNGPCLSK